MAHINLLPWREELRQERQQQFIVAVVAGLIFAVIALYGAILYADSLLDDLQRELNNRKQQVPEEVWHDLERDLVNILQGISVAESVYSMKPTRYEKNIESHRVNNLVKEGDWFYSVDDGFESRQQLISIFEETKEVLFCNYLGIKTNRCQFSLLDDDLQHGRLRQLHIEASLLDVIKKTSVGLQKVSSTQQKARIIAAEKAKKEAEALLAEKELSERAAAIKAREIAERTQTLLKKRAEKQQADKENEIYEQISKCKLGAWITIVSDTIKNQENLNTQNTQRFKLVVKLAASDKYIFVDKLGIKKLEFSESSLMKGILNNEINIISDGAEFEESLERVVSRLRESE